MPDENDAISHELEKLMAEYEDQIQNIDRSADALDARVDRLEDWASRTGELLRRFQPWAKTVNENIRYIRSKIDS